MLYKVARDVAPLPPPGDQLRSDVGNVPLPAVTLPGVVLRCSFSTLLAGN